MGSFVSSAARRLLGRAMTKRNIANEFADRVDDFAMLLGTGTVIYVDSATGASTNDGTAPTRAMATLDQGVGKCTANKGDVIIVMPNHAETLTADAGVDIDVAGVTVIGQGNGENRPTFSFGTAVTADFKINANDVRIFNLLFKCEITDLDMFIEVSGDNAEIDFCEFREGAESPLTAITIGVADGDADYCWVHNCRFYLDEPTITNKGDAAIAIVKDHDNITIEDNHIYGDFDEAGIDVTTAGNACDFLVIRNNFIENTASGQHAIQISTGGTMVGGAVVDNRLASSSPATLLEPHTLQCMGNLGCISGRTNLPDFSVPIRVGDKQIAVKAIAAAGTSFTTGLSPVTIFTVTGDVIVRVWATIGTAVTSTLNNGTLAIGVSGATGGLIAATTADGTNFPTDSAWAGDTSPVLLGEVLSSAALNGFLINDEDIIVTVATNSMTAGTFQFYCEWIPLSAGATVVAA